MSTTKLVVNRNVQNLDPVTFEVLKKRLCEFGRSNGRANVTYMLFVCYL